MFDAGFKRTVVVAASIVCGISAMAAPPGTIHDADHRRVEVTGSLDAQIARLRADVPGPAWLNWTVPVIAGRHTMCCYRHVREADRPDRGMCHLEGKDRSFNHTRDGSSVGARPDLRLLVRIADGKIDNLRVVTTDCSLDVAGLPFYTLDRVGPAQSVGFLESLVLDGAAERYDDRAIMAIALHDDPRAQPALVTLTGPRAPADVREDAVFWLGAARGEAGLERLAHLLEHDPDPDVRDKVVFAISISEADGALDALVAAARRHPRAAVREKALFWLGQHAGKRAVATLERAVADDPDARVREQAVFAVSQLPADEAVPLLIELAKTNPHAEVREKAMFWLGQSGDPRALDLFEAILTD